MRDARADSSLWPLTPPFGLSGPRFLIPCLPRLTRALMRQAQSESDAWAGPLCPSHPSNGFAAIAGAQDGGATGWMLTVTFWDNAHVAQA
jgi:hypothetical protein